VKLTQYFLLTPLPVVVEYFRANAMSPEFASVAQQVLWSAGEHDRSALRREDLNALVKLLFLDSLRREQGDEEHFPSVFPDFAVTEEYFDSYWSLKRIPMDATAEDSLEDAVVSGSIESWMPTGNERLDSVLAEYKQRLSKKA
jgi:hypothetical protein